MNHDLAGNERPRGTLVLADGSEFKGYGFGAVKDVVCEVVFTTAPGGYTETLSDPSYGAQGVVLTFPELGNHGVCLGQMEAPRLHLAAVFVRQFHEGSKDPRAELSVEDWLRNEGVPGLCGIDTRALTFRLRESGSMAGKLCFSAYDKAQVLQELKNWRMPYQVERVSTRERYVLEPVSAANGRSVALLDYGSKRAMAECLAHLACRVTVFPHDTKAETILDSGAHAIFLANGPGDPRDCLAEIEVIRQLLASGKPIFAICLGHQLLSLALGAKIRKMHFGHRGENHPVRRLSDGQLLITSQNHGYVVEREGLSALGIEVTYESVHDLTVEGIRLKGRPVSSVQFHPEAHPGPEDTAYLFKAFVDSLA